MASALSHRAHVVALQEVDLPEASVHDLEAQAHTSGYSLVLELLCHGARCSLQLGARSGNARQAAAVPYQWQHGQ